MSDYTLTEEIRIAEDPASQELIDLFLSDFSVLRPHRDSPGSMAEETRIGDLTRRIKLMRPSLSVRYIERKVRDHVLWFRWPLWKQARAWQRREYPFGDHLPTPRRPPANDRSDGAPAAIAQANRHAVDSRPRKRRRRT